MILSFGSVPKIVKSKSDGMKRSTRKKESFEEKEMDESVAQAITKILKSLNELTLSKDAHILLTELSSKLKDIKFNSNNFCKGIHKYLASSQNFPQITDLRNKFYELI